MPILTTIVGLAVLQGAWKTYPIGSGFQVDLPVKPNAVPMQPAQKGHEYWLAMHQERNPIVVASFPLVKGNPSTPDQVLAGTIAGALDSLGAPLTAQRDILRDGWPGVEYRVSSPSVGMHSIAQTFVVKDAVVMLTVSSASIKALDAPATKLFASLKLPAGAGQGPLKVAGPEFQPHPLGDSGLTAHFPKPPVKETSQQPGQPQHVLHRFTSDYLNRMFIAAYMDFPAEEIDAMSKEDLREVVAETNRSYIQSSGGTNATTTRIKRGDREFLRTTVKLGNGAYFSQCETILLDRRLIVLSVTGPVPLAKSPEVDNFFNSITYP